MTQDDDQTTPVAEEPRDVVGQDAQGFAPAYDSVSGEKALHQEIAALKAQLEQESTQATDYMHKWQRSAADFINYKRRSDQEREDLTRFSNQAIVTQLLTVLDNFDRAFATIPPNLDSLSWVTGVRMIRQQFHGVLMQQGLDPVAPNEGDEYDPRLHEAVVSEGVDGTPDGTILSVFQLGYKMHNRLLRPAMVKVARGGAVTAETSGVAVAVDAQPTEGGTGFDTPQSQQPRADETA